MYTVAVNIFVIDDKTDMDVHDRSGNAMFPVTEYGRTFSTATELKPELVDGDYSILYRISVFDDIDMLDFIRSMSAMFDENLGSNVTIGVSVDTYGPVTDQRFLDSVIRFKRAFEEIDPDNMMIIHFIYDDPEDDDSDDEDDEDIDDDDEEDGDEIDIMKFFNSPFDIDDRPKKKKSSSRKSYSRSRVMVNSKHAKRDIKRHNIVIASKKDFKRDADIIGEFLKDFIPGKSDWAKKYRRKVLVRWLNAFAIREKKVKAMQQDMKRELRAKESKRRAKSIGSKTTTVIPKSSYNPFYDPSK